MFIYLQKNYIFCFAQNQNVFENKICFDYDQPQGI